MVSVLLIMADATKRCHARDRMQSQGFRVYATGDARIALHWLERHSVDVVVADCLMPGTRMAIPHLLRRRGRGPCPKLLGIVHAPLQPENRLRELLGFDELITEATPTAVLTKRILQLH